MHIDAEHFPIIFTCVIEQTCNEGAVPEQGVCGGDVLKVALLKRRVFKHHRLHLQVEEPGEKVTGSMFCACALTIKQHSNVNLIVSMSNPGRITAAHGTLTCH